ncbi:MAG: hypothetical protein QXQ46_11040 [Thermoplasmatales archaeon]
MDWKEKMIVTAGLSGIGEAVVRTLLNGGMKVAIFDLFAPYDSTFE